MLEKECLQELNNRGSELIKVCAVIDYHALPAENSLQHFIRPLYPACSFSRFHLKITENNSRLNAELHLDIRKHRGRTFGTNLSEELDRIVRIIHAQENPSIFATQILFALKGQALFGTREAKNRRGVIERKLVSRAKKARMKKDTRARFLNRKYTLGEYYQSDLEG